MRYQVIDLNIIIAITAITIALNIPGSTGAADGSIPLMMVGKINNTIKVIKIDSASRRRFAQVLNPA
jgi:hypothetical protein